MAYTPNTWQDRTGVGLNQFKDQDGNEYAFTPNPTSITQVGTPFSADWMNHIEQGIAEISKNFSDNSLGIQNEDGLVRAEVEVSEGAGILRLFTAATDPPVNGATIGGATSANNASDLYLFDFSGNTKVQLSSGVGTGAASLSLNGPDNQSIFFVFRASNDSNNYTRIHVTNPQITTSAANVAFVLQNSNIYNLSIVSSSRKYKTNIETVSNEEAEEIIKKINPVSYEEIKTGDKHYGYIAEEMSEACPLLTEYDDEGQPRSIQYDRVSVLLVRALQDVYNRLEKAEAKLQELEGIE